MLGRHHNHIIEYRVYELPLEFPVLLLKGENWRISDVKSNRMHFHNCLEIGLCHSDGGYLVFDDEEQYFRAGDVSIIPRHIPHTTYSQRGAKSLWSYLFVDLEEMFGSSENFDPLETNSAFHFVMNKDKYPRIHFLVNYIIDELMEKKDNYKTMVKSLFLTLYYEYLRIRCEETGKPQDLLPQREEKNAFVLTPALNYIQEAYMNKISVNLLADMCHLSVTHFRRIFLSIMGTPPLNFINSTRIDKACVLLLTTSDSILAISEAVGFPSISSFNRYFSQIMGISPRDYRNPAKRKNVKSERKYVIRYAGWFEPEMLEEPDDDLTQR